MSRDRAVPGSRVRLDRRAIVQMLLAGSVTGCSPGRSAAEDGRARKGVEVRCPAATLDALIAADYRASTTNATLRLPAGRYVLGTLRIAAPRVAFDAGAVIVPADDGATIVFAGPVDGPVVRLFEVAERASGGLAAIQLAHQMVRPEWWGATASGAPDHGDDDSLAWQQAIDALAGAGGTILATAGATYPIRYPLVVTGADIAIDLNGARLLTDIARKQRAPGCVLLIGDSREWNLARVRARRIAADLFNSFENPDYVDIGMLMSGGQTNIAAGRFPDAADPGRDGFTARRCSVRNGRIEYYDDVYSPGNYGVQFANAADCRASGLKMRNVGQGFGFGSDTPPRVPYAVNCHVGDLVVERVNMTHTYYGAGFHGYARDCHDERVSVLAGVYDWSTDGNLWATNFALDCTSTATGGVCGRGSNGEGFAIGPHTRRCTIRDARVSNARRAFVNFSPLDIQPADGSSVIGGTASDVDYLIALESRDMRFENVRGRGVRTAEVLADNVNATGNTLIGCDVARIATGTVPMAQVRRANTIT